MAHRIFDTTAIVVGGFPVGEANQYVALLTKELGLVRAVARSMRKETSKLRYALQKYSKGEVSLVRGKDVWRVVGAVPTTTHFVTLRACPEKRALIRRVSTLIERMHGEVPHPYAFDTTLSLYVALEGEWGTDMLPHLELLSVLRLLYSFGYIGNDTETAPYLVDASITNEILGEIAIARTHILPLVNQALQASQV